MIHLIYGPNDYERAAIARRLSGAHEVAHPGVIMERYEAGQLDVAALTDLWQGVSLFQPARTIVVDGLAQVSALWQHVPMLGEGDEPTLMILVEPQPDKRTRTYKWLQKQATIHEAPSLDAAACVRWLSHQASQQQVRLTPALARLLVERIGTDQRQLSHELAKLALVEGPLSESVIRDVTEATPQASAFELLDAALRGDSHRLASLLPDIASVEDPYRFFGLLSSQIHALAVAASSQGASSEAVARRAGIHPFVLKKATVLVRHKTPEQIATIINHAAATDLLLKGDGSATPWRVIALCLNQIAAS